MSRQDKQPHTIRGATVPAAALSSTGQKRHRSVLAAQQRSSQRTRMHLPNAKEYQVETRMSSRLFSINVFLAQDYANLWLQYAACWPCTVAVLQRSLPTVICIRSMGMQTPLVIHRNLYPEHANDSPLHRIRSMHRRLLSLYGVCKRPPSVPPPVWSRQSAPLLPLLSPPLPFWKLILRRVS